MATKKKTAKPGIELPQAGEGMNKLPPPIGSEAGDVPTNARGDPNPAMEEAAEKKRKADKEKDAELIRRAVKRFKRCDDFESENRGEALEDLKFMAGDQWPADDQAERNTAKRPCLVVNKIPTLVHQVTNDIRENRPAINYSPMGDEATRESAQMVADLVRSIERESAAEVAYDKGMETQTQIGFGYWRVLTEYGAADSLDQVIVVRRIRNPFTVLLDYARQEPDGCDSRFGFVSEMVDRDDFKDQWPTANPISWTEATVGTDNELWATKDRVRVAEYFEVTHEHKRVVRLETGDTLFYEDLGRDVKARIAAGTLKIVAEREAEVQRVDWYRLTAYEVLERRRWPGKWIPVVEVVGEELDIEGKVIRSGIIRPAKDPQRMKNYWATTKTELYGMQTKSPWVAPEGSFEGYEDEWRNSNRENITYLEFVQQYGENGAPLPGPQRQGPPQVAAGYVEAEKSAEQDMMATTGVRFDSSKQERMYDESGKAIKELRRSSDIGNSHYADNFKRSLRHTGRIFLDLIPKVYSGRRQVAIVGEDGKESRIMLDSTAPKAVGKLAPANQQTEPMKVLNPKKGQYGVTITIGPSYATKRIEAQEQLSGFIGKIPENMRGVVAALMAKYSDWPGSNELYKALAQMVPPGLLAPDLGNLPPEIAAQMRGMQQQVQKLLGERAQMIRDLSDQRADRDLVRKRIEKDFEAKVLKIFADLTKTADKHRLDALGMLSEADREISTNFTGQVPTGDGGGEVVPLGAPPGPRAQGEAPVNNLAVT